MEMTRSCVSTRYSCFTVAAERADRWDEDEVLEWLMRCKLEEHASAFRCHAIDGTALAGLWRMEKQGFLYERALIKHLGMTKFGDRLRLVA